MTATLPRQGPPNLGGPVSLTREYRLYRFFDDHNRLLYLGMTGRMSLERLIEHVKTKAWAREVACWERDPRVWYDEQACLAVERAAIIAERPLHNVAHNGNNPGAVAMRRPPTRVPSRPRPEQSALSAVGDWVGLRLLHASRTLPFRTACLWLALTAALGLLAAWAAAKIGVPLPPEWAAGVGGLAATVVIVKWWRPTKRVLRHTRRRTR